MTGHAILTPMLMVIIMLTGDLLGMALATDNVRPSPAPNAWRIGSLTLAGVFMGLARAGLLHRRAGDRQVSPRATASKACRTLAFVAIVFGNQATTYTNRERGRMWSSRPSRWLVGSSVVDLLIASTLATCGIAMAPLPVVVVGGTARGHRGLRRCRGLCEGSGLQSPPDRVTGSARSAPGSDESIRHPRHAFPAAGVSRRSQGRVTLHGSGAPAGAR